MALRVRGFSVVCQGMEVGEGLPGLQVIEGH